VIPSRATRSSNRSSSTQGRTSGHLPSGSYTAIADWVAAAVIAFNLARAATVATGFTTTLSQSWTLAIHPTDT
jgi:hypothetical protein